MLVPQLLSIAAGTDRAGRMPPSDGQNLRDQLLRKAQELFDRPSTTLICVDAGKRAEKGDDVDLAHQW